MNAGFVRTHWKALICLFICILTPVTYAAPPGTLIDNTAQATFDVGAAIGVTENSNLVSVTTTVIRTPSTLNLLQYQPAAVAINEETPSQCRMGDGGAFVVSANPSVAVIGSGTTILDPATALPLNTATLYNSNEPVFIQLEDNDQNVDSTAADMVVVSISSSLGDSEEVLLTETDLNTGVFIGYVQTAGSTVVLYDCVLSVAPDTSVSVGYTDPADGTDTSAATSLVDPFGIIFSSVTGDPVDGITVRLVNSVSGLPAEPGVEIFGNDGVSAFPNTLVTGSTATDSAGTVYNFPAGGYRFPLVLPGDYRLEVINAGGYTVPSNVAITDLQLLPGAPFALDINASYGQNFVVAAGPPLHVDIPIDPHATELVVSKASFGTDAAVGDFVRYQVSVENVESLASSVEAVVTDTLPVGFRYQTGSVRLNGNPAGDPLISANGRVLEFSVGDIAPGQTITLAYVTEVSAGTPLGDAVNSAGATDTLGSTSNTAQVVVNIRDELMREHNTIVGRIIAGNCALEKPVAGRSSLRLQSVRQGEQIYYEIKFGVENTALRDYRIQIELPQGLHYIPSSSLLGDYVLQDPEFNGRTMVFKINPRNFQNLTRWQYSLRFRAQLDTSVYGRQETVAGAHMTTLQGIEHSTPVATNVLLRQQSAFEERQFVFRPIFPTMEASLAEQDRQQLDKIIDVIRDIDVVKVSIEGHADKRQISGNDAPYTDNFELSHARAKAIAPYFQAALRLSDEQVTVTAAGDKRPIAGSDSESGLALNRRVDIAVTARVRTGNKVDELVVKDSGQLTGSIIAETERGDAVVGGRLDGVAGVRIYLEDGSYVISDENGKYHFEGVRPGTHVLQLDLSSLPPGMRIVECERNSRFAGSASSQFIDLQPGSMWRADFHVEEIPPPVSHATMQMFTEIDNGILHYRIDNNGGKLGVNNYRLTVMLPEGVRYQTGSSRIDKRVIDDPQIADNIIVYRLGDLPAGWDLPVTFDAVIDVKVSGKLISKAAVVFDDRAGSNQRIAPVETVALLDKGAGAEKQYLLNPDLDEPGTELSVADKRKLDALLPELLQDDIRRITVKTYTGSSAENPNDGKQEKAALSAAHAKAVANYLGTSLGLDNKDVIALEINSSEVVARTAESGETQNHHTQIVVETAVNETVAGDTMLRSSSDKVSADVTGEKNSSEKHAAFKLPPTTKLSIDQFDEAWLEQAQPGIEWLMPVPEFIPEVRAVSVAIKHAPQDRIEGFINGEPLNPLFYFGVKQNRRGSVARSYWQGIHLKDGTNRLEFRIYPPAADKAVVLERLIHFSSAPVKAELVPEYSNLIADGRTPPVLAVRFFDRNGKPVRGGVVGEFDVQPPYQSKQYLESMSEDKLAAYDRNRPLYHITERGIAYIELEPTAQSGKAMLRFKLDNEHEQQIEAWLKPSVRDWIVVGLGEGIVGRHDVSGDSTAATAHNFEDGDYNDGRLALFAKGGLGENWLLTTAIDSDKQESATGQGLFQTVDPDSYFGLYGDDTDQRYEASSSEKLFLRVENDRFYSMYGDYDTGLNATELSKYNRRITGLKSEYDSQRFGLNAFAAETGNRFVRDEIQGDGTSGLYRLRGADIIINSETIVIETRDRFHSQDILEQRTLRRHYDYNIDYLTGTVFFKQPVMSRDQNFNPVFIVAEYETQTGVADELTAGGRGEMRLLDGDIKLGLSAISDGSFAEDSELYGLDAEVKLGLNSKLRLELAASETDDAGSLLEGNAYLAEYEANHERFDGRIYIREQEDGFGVGQQAGSETATRKLGLDGSYQLNEKLRLNSEVFQEENLATGAERDIAELDLSYSGRRNLLMAGMRSARDTLGDGQENESELLLAGAGTKLFDNKLQLHLNTEYAIDDQNANSAYPTRHIAGADYAISSGVTAFLEQEVTEGERQDTNATRFGIRATPWAQANINTSVEQQTGEYGPRTFALMGLTQGFRLNERWSADLSYDRAETIRDPGDTPFNTNVPPQSGTYNNDFDAVSSGLTRRGDNSTMVMRLEQRNAETDDRQGLLLGWHRDLRDGIGYGVDSQWFVSEYADGSETSAGNLRLSLAYRPLASNWIYLNRFDYKHDERIDSAGSESRQRKLINNWKVNYLPDRRNQIAISYGVKYVLDTYDETEYKGMTHSAGSEYRYDITTRWDVGAHADVLYSANADNRLYSYGLSTGYNLIRNLWISVGYNFAGFRDDDFTSAEYTADGPYIKLRFKFDQDSFGSGN